MLMKFGVMTTLTSYTILLILMRIFPVSQLDLNRKECPKKSKMSLLFGVSCFLKSLSMLMSPQVCM